MPKWLITVLKYVTVIPILAQGVNKLYQQVRDLLVE